MRKLGTLLLVMALALLSVAFAANYSVQYYYGGYQPEKQHNFGIKLYYGSIKVDGNVGNTTYTGIGGKLFYNADKYRVYADYFSGNDGNSLKEFNLGVGYALYKADAYRLMADLVYRNIDFGSKISGLGLKVALGAPVSEDNPMGYRVALIWFPSYSGDFNDEKSFGWEIGLGIRLAENFNGSISYASEDFNGGGDFNYYTFKVGFCYKF